jgi:DNA-directed RNA polymerase specialized sigma24 family protein
MKIPEDTLNSNIEYCIDEYVRLYEHRDMLREKWFKGKTLEEIAELHNISVTQVKNIIYTLGDKILVRASKM